MDNAEEEYISPEQVRVGSKQFMSYAQRVAFLSNSEMGRLIGFPQCNAPPELLASEAFVKFLEERLAKVQAGETVSVQDLAAEFGIDWESL